LCAPWLLGAATLSLVAQAPQHTGTKLVGFATQVTPNSITVFDKAKQEEVQILTEKDYSSLIGIAAPVTVWYKTEGGVRRLEDIVYPTGGGFVPTSLPWGHIKQIIILPHAEGVENCQGLFDAISQYLSDNTGWFVAPTTLAQEIVRRSSLSDSPLDAVDPNTGQVNMEQYMNPQRFLVMKIAEETRSDAVMDVQVTKVKATVHANVASWDDMRESVATRSSRILSPLSNLGGKGWVSAATVELNLWSRAGKLLWQKRQGFAVLGVQSGVGGRYHQRPLTEVYKNSAAMQHWLETTLRELAPVHVPPARPPLSPDLQQQLEKIKQAGEEQK
jgi:hypothetical protein